MLRARTGLGFIAKGVGARAGELLLATRGSKILCDWVTDFHTGVRPGPAGQRVHIGFMRAWESFKGEIDEALAGGGLGHAHCVGHSLGGALANLNADYCANARGLGVSLYTFGAPRVGLFGFSEMLTRRTREAVFRVAHDTDPVTMVPPTSGPFRFTHVPCDRPGHVISLKGLINPWDHLMERYVRSVANKNWKNVERGMRVCQMTDHEGEVLLESIAHNRGGVIQMFGAGTARVLGAALMWLLRKAIGGAALAGASSFTVLDHLCLMRERLADCTRDAKLAGKFKTVMGGILGYLGQVAPLAMEVTLHTVSWVISLLRSACERMARSALASVG